MLDYISKHGCNHGIDYVMKIVPNLLCYESQPQLAYSIWNENGADIDTDIQNNGVCFNFSSITDDIDLASQYIFVPNMDQYGHDIIYHHRKTLQEYFILSETDKNCVGFNTLGYFKHKIENLTTSQVFGTGDGIYIKKTYCELLKKNKENKNKYTFTNTWFHDSNLKKIIKISNDKCIFYNDNDVIYQLDKTNIINVLEIGCHEGAFSTFIADNLLFNDKSIIHCIDPFNISDDASYDNNTKSIFLNNIQQSMHNSKIIHFETSSDVFFNSVNTSIQYDLIYIDGLHTPEQVIKDINNSCARLSYNGIFWIDYNDDCLLKQCIDEWYIAHNDIYDIVYKQCQIAFTHKKKKNAIRVKMLCNWCSSKQLCKEFSNMCDDVSRLRWKNIEMTWTDVKEDIDYYVIINSADEKSYFDPSKTFVFQMEPWVNDPIKNWGVKTWGKWAIPDFASFLHVHDHKTNLNNVQWQINIPLREQFNISQPKQNIITATCSNKNYDDGHILRNNFIKYAENKLEHGAISVFGRQNYHQFKSYVGSLLYDDKMHGLIPYKYTIAVENNSETGYATEKIWEPILCECLCFYWGCPNLEEYIDSRAFVRLPLDNFEESLCIIKKAINEDWHTQRIDIIRQEKQKILNKIGFFPTLERLIQRIVI